MNLALLTFFLEGKRYALHIGSVERVIKAVEVSALPGSPPIVTGVINMHGEIVPVFNIRERFGLKTKAIGANDLFIIATTRGLKVALVVDSVGAVEEFGAQMVARINTMINTKQYIEGIVRLPDNMVLIHDLDTFLSLEEEKQLDKSLKSLSKRKNSK